MRDPLSRALSRLFLDVGLLFKVNGMERVVFLRQVGCQSRGMGGC
jgi:hypothetical protein